MKIELASFIALALIINAAQMAGVLLTGNLFSLVGIVASLLFAMASIMRGFPNLFYRLIAAKRNSLVVARADEVGQKGL